MLCNQWKQNRYKVSRLGSTQPNESFNRSVSLKAPKNHHFSGSASLNYRIAATVAEKNSGDSYLIAVNKKKMDYLLESSQKGYAPSESYNLGRGRPLPNPRKQSEDVLS